MLLLFWPIPRTAPFILEMINFKPKSSLFLHEETSIPILYLLFILVTYNIHVKIVSQRTLRSQQPYGISLGMLYTFLLRKTNSIISIVSNGANAFWKFKDKMLGLAFVITLYQSQFRTVKCCQIYINHHLAQENVVKSLPNWHWRISVYLHFNGNSIWLISSIWLGSLSVACRILRRNSM